MANSPAPYDPEPDQPWRFGRPGRRKGWLRRRHEAARDEIERNRRGEPSIPTWVLALALVIILAAWAGLVIFA